jgi:hypothetical protein
VGGGGVLNTVSQHKDWLNKDKEWHKQMLTRIHIRVYNITRKRLLNMLKKSWRWRKGNNKRLEAAQMGLPWPLLGVIMHVQISIPQARSVMTWTWLYISQSVALLFSCRSIMLDETVSASYRQVCTCYSRVRFVLKTCYFFAAISIAGTTFNAKKSLISVFYFLHSLITKIQP